MHKEPIALYIFRFIMGLGLFAFMAMLYWSSLLIEQDMQELRSDLTDIKQEIITLRSEGLSVRQQTSPQQITPPLKKTQKTIESEYPNLLTEDKFRSETLATLLGPNFKPTGTFKRATAFKPEDLRPFSGWRDINNWIGLCSISLANSHFGKFETMSPALATRIEERGKNTNNPEYWVYLRNDVYWEPLDPNWFDGRINLAPQFLQKHQVTAHDVKFFFDAIMNPYNQEVGALTWRNYIGDIEEVRVIDDLTLVIRWKTHEFDGKKKILYIAEQYTGSLRPLASFVYKYFPNGKKIVEDDSDPNTYRTNSLWAQNFAEHWAKNIIVSCGPWVFNGKNDERIRFKRNRDFYDPYAALAEGIIYQFKGSPDLIWQAFKNNQLEEYLLQPSQQVELENFLETAQYKEQKNQGDAIERLDYVGRTYSYIGWNQANPLFKSKKVRQALTMAIDRERIIKQFMFGMGIPINGTFYRFSPSYDDSIPLWPFSPSKAKRLLAQEGWFDSDGDGILDKTIKGERVPFRFGLTYYVKSPLSKTVAEYISTALKGVGIDCQLEGVDRADLSAAFDGKSFDAILGAWALGSPPESPRQLWFSKGAKEPGSSNIVGFSNAEADAIIAKLDFESDREKRIKLYHEFDKIIHEEAPYTFLFTPKSAFLYRSYVKNVFLPSDRQDLVPGANISEPDESVFWLNKGEK